jgi:hypothetical protein
MLNIFLFLSERISIAAAASSLHQAIEQFRWLLLFFFFLAAAILFSPLLAIYVVAPSTRRLEAHQTRCKFN